MNWAMHRAHYIRLLKKGRPRKAAYDEAIRYTVEQDALSITREVTEVNDTIQKIAIDAITIIQHLGQYELAELLMNRYEELTR